MPLNGFFPKPGQVLLCDFNRGFVPPEMVKSRPCVVVSAARTHGRRLCCVVPLSTTAPNSVHGLAHRLPQNPCPDFSAAVAVWAKCDMLYTVSFERLNKLHKKTRKGRVYYVPTIEAMDLVAIRACIRAYLEL